MDELWSSISRGVNVIIPKDIEDMTEEELNSFRNSLDADSMESDGQEYVGDGGECCDI